MQAVSIASGSSLAPSLTQHLERFMARMPPSIGGERREANRVAIPSLLRITPLERPGGCELAPSVTAVGKDLSKAGIGFFHQQPLPHRHVVVSFEGLASERVSVEVELQWCRFSNLGWYESGGRLLRIVEPTIDASLAS